MCDPASMPVHERVVRALRAYGDRYDDYDERDPLIGVARERYSELKRQGKDFATCSFIARCEMVETIIAQDRPRSTEAVVPPLQPSGVVWFKTSECRPTLEPGGQVDVLFASPGWSWAILGMYTHFPDEFVADGNCRWAIYDQLNDRFSDFLGPAQPEPEYWTFKPELPSFETP